MKTSILLPSLICFLMSMSLNAQPGTLDTGFGVNGFVKFTPALPLLQAIPNLAAGKTEFLYRLPEGMEHAKIVITTSTGIAITEIIIENTTGKIAWETKGLPNGAYLYSLKAGKETLRTERLMIIK